VKIQKAQTTLYNVQNLPVSRVRHRISVMVNCGQGYVRDSVAVRIRIRISVGLVFLLFCLHFRMTDFNTRIVYLSQHWDTRLNIDRL